MTKAYLLLIISMLCLTCHVSAQITMSTNNCKITEDEIQMDVTITNNSSRALRWNGAVLRMQLPKGMLPENAASLKYSCVYIGGSDFPLSFPDGPGKRAGGSTFNPKKLLLTLSSTSNMAYSNADCNAPLIPPGSTKTIGRFSFRLISGKFRGSKGELKWNPTSGCILYEGCGKVVKAFNTGAVRKFGDACN